jgi:hypothetical protein
MQSGRWFISDDSSIQICYGVQIAKPAALPTQYTSTYQRGYFASIARQWRWNQYDPSTCRGADKSLARPTSRCILFDGENILFDASLVTRRCAPSRKVPGSIPGRVTRIFSEVHVPGVDSAFRNEYQDIPGGKDGRCVGLTTEPSRPRRPFSGLLYFIYLFIYIYIYIVLIFLQLWL